MAGLARLKSRWEGFGAATAGHCWLLPAVGGLWLAAVAWVLGLAVGRPQPPGLARTGHWLAAVGCGLASAGRGVLGLPGAWLWPASAGGHDGLDGWYEVVLNFGCEIDGSHAIVVLRPPPSQVDSPCQAWWDALDGLTVVLRWRMSCVGPVTAWRPPALVRPTPGASVPSVVRASCSSL